MINTKRISLTVSGSGKEPFEANYAVIKQRVHLFISRLHEVRGFISQAFLKEMGSNVEGVLFNCQLVAVGEEYDEYQAKIGCINENKSSYEANNYIKAVFALSNDLLRFFPPVWDIDSPMMEQRSQILTFVSDEERKQFISLSEDVSLSIHRGYRQSYSKIRYEAHSSVVFYLDFHTGASREHIFSQIQAVADYYSLFCKNFIRIGAIRLRPNDKQQVGYFGEPANDASEREYFANALIEQEDLDQYSDNAIIEWVAKYDKSKTCLALMRDGEKVKESQLRFICYSRALEVFHKEFFVNADSQSNSYFDQLYDFVSSNSLASIQRDKFGGPKLKLAHRLYDLVRYVYPIVSDNKFRLIFGYLILKDRIQQLTDTRNYLIHFSESKRTKAWKLEDLPHLNYGMFMMLKVLFMQRFGFTEKAIRSTVHTFYRDYFGL